MKLGAIFVVLIFMCTSAVAKEFDFQFSGTSVSHPEFDFDGNLSGFMSHGRGDSTFGSASNRATGDVADWDMATFCDFDELGNPIAIELDYLEDNTAISFDKGGRAN